MHSLIQLKRATPVFLIVLGFVWLGLLPKAQAVTPAPDGGYPGGNTAEGQSALLSLTTGRNNTGVGFLSLRGNTTGANNTAIGAGALAANTGDNNTATGTAALFRNTTGLFNVADGAFALFSNTTGIQNTASGATALFSNTSGNNNTAIGISALESNTTGSGNTANGYKALINNVADGNTATGALALFTNTTGSQNTANGLGALSGNTIGNANTATGYQALSANASRGGNTANGAQALLSNTGDSNTATGFQALMSNTTGRDNTAMGSGALFFNTAGNGNTAVGTAAGSNVTTADNVICIGANVGGASVSNTCFIGNIRGVTTQNADAIPVLIDSNSQLGTASSSRRYKTDIKPMNRASESILALKPVSFRYKIHKNNPPQFDLIAEEVAEVNPNLVIYDADGKPYTVRYDAVNAMLLNEFLKEHRKVEQLTKDSESKFAAQQKQIEGLTATVKEQAAQIQKVSAQLEVSKPPPQTAQNTD